MEWEHIDDDDDVDDGAFDRDLISYSKMNIKQKRNYKPRKLLCLFYV